MHGMVFLVFDPEYNFTQTLVDTVGDRKNGASFESSTVEACPPSFFTCHSRRTAPTELEGREMDDGSCRAHRRHEQSSGYVHVGRETAQSASRDNSDEDGETTDPVRRQASSRRAEPPDMPEGVRDRDGGVGVETDVSR